VARSTGGLVASGTTRYDFASPLDADGAQFGDALIDGIMASRAFRRLKGVRFLGGIDYVLVRSPNGSRARYSRYEHSVGVACLAALHADLRDLSPEDRRLSCAAALLHDIGHAPLSHSLEPVFIEHFGLGHHRATEEIIYGRVAIGREISSLIREHGVDADRLVALIGGKDDRFDGFFAGPINFDTIEGILRTHSYARNSVATPDPQAVVRASVRRAGDVDRQLVDAFWGFKHLVYTQLINAELGVLADAACQQSMRDNIVSFTRDDYFTDEAAAFRKMPGLRELLVRRDFGAEAANRLGRSIAFRRRSFFIDEDTDFFSRQDRDRYKQSKTGQILKIRDDRRPKTTNLNRDLFDEDAIST
jgi:hypothetical protein